MLSLVLLLLCCDLSVAPSWCWVGGYSRELCCDESLGPRGNVNCWDDVFHYDPCCTKGDEAPHVADAEEEGHLAEAQSDEEILLERSLGAKLDFTLSENNQTLGGLEEDLRRTISTPENRSMAGPMTYAYLSLVLHRQGRTAEATEAFKQYLANDFSISENGVWVGSSAEGYHMHDVPFSEALVSFLTSQGARSVGDFGCGLGLYVRDMRRAGLRAGGFDGNPATAEITAGRCLQLDLSREVDLGTRWDWVLSLEVAEHIPKQFEEIFLGNLLRHTCFGLVLSWGNQAGEGHVNVKPREEVELLFSDLGFRSEAVAAAALRQAARLPWLQNTVLVLERLPPYPSDCGGRPAAPHPLPPQQF